MAASIVNSYLGNSAAECFSVFGVVAASYIALKLSCSVLSGIKTFILSSTINFRKYGTWAVVTGATDGIGKAYAEQLAAKGMDIILISRSPEKLADVAMEIESKYQVKTKTIPIDFSNTEGIYEKIRQEVSSLDLGVLVNNVGMGYSHPEYFAELDDKTICNLINVNLVSAVMVTKTILPAMVEKRKGVIINISSASACAPSPLLTVYSAAKVFLDYFSRGLQVEYASKGIIIQSVTPFFVATKLSKIRRATFFAPSPKSYVSSALATVGSQRATFGCLSHALQGYVVKSVPEWISIKVTYFMMQKVRKAALKRASKKQ